MTVDEPLLSYPQHTEYVEPETCWIWSTYGVTDTAADAPVIPRTARMTEAMSKWRIVGAEIVVP